MQKRVGGADIATIALSLVVSACGSDSHKAATDDAGSSSDETGDGGPELPLGTFCLTIAGEEDCVVYKDAAIRHPPDFEYGMAITFSSTQEPYVSLHVAEPASTTTPFVTSDLGFFLEFRGTCTTSSAMESMRCGARSAGKWYDHWEPEQEACDQVDAFKLTVHSLTTSSFSGELEGELSFGCSVSSGAFLCAREDPNFGWVGAKCADAEGQAGTFSYASPQAVKGRFNLALVADGI